MSGVEVWLLRRRGWGGLGLFVFVFVVAAAEDFLEDVFLLGLSRLVGVGGVAVGWGVGWALAGVRRRWGLAGGRCGGCGRLCRRSSG